MTQCAHPTGNTKAIYFLVKESGTVKSLFQQLLKAVLQTSQFRGDLLLFLTPGMHLPWSGLRGQPGEAAACLRTIISPFRHMLMNSHQSGQVSKFFSMLLEQTFL